jgi:hypothetical protein
LELTDGVIGAVFVLELQQALRDHLDLLEIVEEMRVEDLVSAGSFEAFDKAF